MSDPSKASLHVGIFGPGLSGKTTLAKSLSRDYWNHHGIKSLVLDPNLETWGQQAWVTDDEKKFWPMFWKEKRCAVFIDEAADTVARNRGKSSVFTRSRHQGHKVHVLGHSGASLLPEMRLQLHTLFLFRQPNSAAEVWAELYADTDIFRACELRQFEFLRCRLYQPVEGPLTLAI
jgi:hypothetical protein